MKEQLDKVIVGESLTGISNVKTTVDFDNYIASISCNFTQVTRLNDVVKNVYAKENSKEKPPEKIYGYSAGSKTFFLLSMNTQN